MDTGRARLLRNAAAALGVLAVILVVSVGLPRLDAALPSHRQVPAGPYSIGAGVSVVPPPGAALDVTATRPGPDSGRVLFVLGGSVRYALVAMPYTGTVQEASTALRRRITSQRGYQITSADEAVHTAAGVAGRQGTYSTSGREGRYVVFLSGGVVVDVTVSGNAPELRRTLPVIERSVASLSFRDQR